MNKQGQQSLRASWGYSEAKSTSACETDSDAGQINIPVDTTGQDNTFHIPGIS